MTTKNQEIIELLKTSNYYCLSEKTLANGDIELEVKLTAKTIDLMGRCKFLEENYESLLGTVIELFQVVRDMADLFKIAEIKNAKQ